MNVNLSTMHIYKANAVNPVQHESGAYGQHMDTAKVGAMEKMDTISISRQAADRQLAGRMTKDIMGELRELDDPARLDEIAKAVEQGGYRVSAGELADAILDRAAGL